MKTFPNPEQLMIYIDALADCICWFKGFSHAKGDEQDMPPQWRNLIELQGDLKEYVTALKAERQS